MDAYLQQKLLNALCDDKDIGTRLYFIHAFENERRRLVEEIKREVLNSLSVEVDISNAIQEIERLNAEIDKLRK